LVLAPPDDKISTINPNSALGEVLDRLGAKRRKTAFGSPKGEHSESINKIHRMGY
jgi:hypothetical protein